MKHLISIVLVAAAFILHPFIWQLHFDCVDTVCESKLGEAINNLDGAMYFIATESLVRFPFGPFCFLLGGVGSFAFRASKGEILAWIPVGLMLRSVADWTTADVDWDTQRLMYFATEMVAEASAIPMMFVGFRLSRLAVALRFPSWRICDLLGIVFATAVLIASSRIEHRSVLGFCFAILLLSCTLAILLDRSFPTNQEDDEPRVCNGGRELTIMKL